MTLVMMMMVVVVVVVVVMMFVECASNPCINVPTMQQYTDPLGLHIQLWHDAVSRFCASHFHAMRFRAGLFPRNSF